ncbi:MAG: galactose ABC transporter substrate-binding protein [Treponema sp.]|nr:galactose ABC transporter substrate-binding protein [Treponema sp.]
MKKAMFIFLIVALAFSFAACAPKSSSAGGGGGQPSIGVTIYKFDDTFMSYVRNNIQSNAAGKANVDVVDSQNSQPMQNDQVDAFISRKVNSMAINSVDRTAAASIIEKARGANIPVVFFNREPMPEDMASWDKVYYVGAKAEESGTMQGSIAVDWWLANKGKDQVLRYIMLRGEPGHQDAELRREYAIKAVTDAGIKVECLAEDYANWDRPKAVEKMDAFWAQFGDRIDMVFANNDDMALGAIESLKNVGFFQGGRYMPVLGVDATAPALAALEEGTLLGTVLNDADNQGKATFDLAFALATGNSASSAGWTISDGKYIWVPYQKVTIDNYRQYMK